jgi:hypothetical protein
MGNLGLQQYKQDSRKNEGSTHRLGPLQNESCNVPSNIAEHAELQQARSIPADRFLGKRHYSHITHDPQNRAQIPGSLHFLATLSYQISGTSLQRQGHWVSLSHTPPSTTHHPFKHRLCRLIPTTIMFGKSRCIFVLPPSASAARLWFAWRRAFDGLSSLYNLQRFLSATQCDPKLHSSRPVLSRTHASKSRSAVQSMLETCQSETHKPYACNMIRQGWVGDRYGAVATSTLG